jgi:TolA-binding protein
MSSRWLALFAVLALSTPGCVYYNTFFHARQAYKDADEQRQRSGLDVATGSIALKYQDAIKKASKVLQNHPKSKYADDALLMIGKAYYHTGDYTRAKEKFVELSTVFRESGHVPESRFYLGMCEYYLGNPEKSRQSLQEIAESGKREEFRDLSAFMLARIPFEEEDYETALPALHAYAAAYSGSTHALRADSMIAACYWETEKYDSARTAFAKLAAKAEVPELKYHALYRRSESAYKIEDYATGIGEFRAMAEDDRYFEHAGILRYQVGMGLVALDSVDAALEIFRKLPAEFAKSEEAARSLYAMGDIYETRGESLSVAQSFFNEIRTTWTRDEDFASLAAQRASQIARLLSLQGTISGEDSTRLAQTHFLLGELYSQQMAEPDSALEQFRLVVDDYPESEYAPLALLNIAELRVEAQSDSTEAQRIWKTLVDRYPAGEAAMWARSIIGIPLPDDITQSDVLLLRGAEAALLELNDPDSALKLYDLLLERFPNSRYRAKANYAIAWVKDQYFPAEDSSVVLAYMRVIDSFPATEYAENARNRLNPPQRTARPIVAALDTAKTDTTYADTAAPKVTIADTQDTVKTAPEPLFRGPFEYPVVPGYTWRTEVAVVFLIHIDDRDGRVKDDLILIGGSGHKEIDDQARRTVLQTRFDPLNLDVYFQATGKWYKYSLVIPPEGQEQNDPNDPFNQGQQ